MNQRNRPKDNGVVRLLDKDVYMYLCLDIRESMNRVSNVETKLLAPPTELPMVRHHTRLCRGGGYRRRGSVNVDGRTTTR